MACTDLPPTPGPLQAAKEVVLAEKPVITDDSNNLDPLLLDQLLSQLSTLASVYHKPADTFISRQRMAVQKVGTASARIPACLTAAHPPSCLLSCC
jgi:hypothetical protein